MTLLLAYKCPYLIALHESATQVPHGAVHQVGAMVACSQQQGCDGVAIHASHAVGGSDGVALDERDPLRAESNRPETARRIAGAWDFGSSEVRREAAVEAEFVPIGFLREWNERYT